MLYNNTSEIFKNTLGRAKFIIADGHIVSFCRMELYRKGECLARCKDDAEAEQVLTGAGFKKNEFDVYE